MPPSRPRAAARLSRPRPLGATRAPAREGNRLAGHLLRALRGRQPRNDVGNFTPFPPLCPQDHRGAPGSHERAGGRGLKFCQGWRGSAPQKCTSDSPPGRAPSIPDPLCPALGVLPIISDTLSLSLSFRAVSLQPGQRVTRRSTNVSKNNNNDVRNCNLERRGEERSPRVPTYLASVRASTRENTIICGLECLQHRSPSQSGGSSALGQALVHTAMRRSDVGNRPLPPCLQRRPTLHAVKTPNHPGELQGGSQGASSFCFHLFLEFTS